jgi:hypothetical protein
MREARAEGVKELSCDEAGTIPVRRVAQYAHDHPLLLQYGDAHPAKLDKRVSGAAAQILHRGQ